MCQEVGAARVDCLVEWRHEETLLEVFLQQSAKEQRNAVPIDCSSPQRVGIIDSGRLQLSRRVDVHRCEPEPPMVLVELEEQPMFGSWCDDPLDGRCERVETFRTAVCEVSTRCRGLDLAAEAS
jgi:hypothetical protein